MPFHSGSTLRRCLFAGAFLSSLVIVHANLVQVTAAGKISSLTGTLPWADVNLGDDLRYSFTLNDSAPAAFGGPDFAAYNTLSQVVIVGAHQTPLTHSFFVIMLHSGTTNFTIGARALDASDVAASLTFFSFAPLVTTPDLPISIFPLSAWDQITFKASGKAWSAVGSLDEFSVKPVSTSAVPEPGSLLGAFAAVVASLAAWRRRIFRTV